MDKQKKQTMMVGVLLLVLVAVGAFQFMGPKPAPAKTEVATDGEGPATTEVSGGTIEGGEPDVVATNDGEAADPAAVDPMLANQLPARDPFMPTSAAERAAKENAEQGLKTAAPVNPPQNNVQQPPRFAGNGNGSGMGSFSNPVNPLPDVNATGIGLPPVAGGGAAPGNLEPAKRTGYKVVGTIVGKQKMVVLEDPDGNQVLVPEGGKTPDKKARVLDVEKGKAKVRQDNQVKMLGLEEE